MTFKLPTSNNDITSIFDSLYNLKMKIYQSDSAGLMAFISILLIITIILGLIGIMFKTLKDDENQSKSKPWLKKEILGETLKTWIKMYICAGAFIVIGIIVTTSIYLGSNPYVFVNSSIIPGTAIINKEFGSQSNTEDLDLDDNKLLLSDTGDTLLLATASRTHHTLTLKPASKTGKAYLRILNYAKKHKRDIYNPTLTVQLDKTTLKYTDINGDHTVVCYANNQNQSTNTNHETVLHY